jgi:Sigma-70, region 4
VTSAPDGAAFGIEIPSIEGRRRSRAVQRAAEAEGITVNRVSQGTGAVLMPAAEVRDVAQAGPEVLVLRDVPGFGSSEVAAMLDSSEATVNSALQRGRATMESRMPDPDRPTLASGQPAFGSYQHEEQVPVFRVRRWRCRPRAERSVLW